MWTASCPSLLAHLSSDCPSGVLGGGTLRTCVLRPPGIYGPEEQRHLPRVAVCGSRLGPEEDGGAPSPQSLQQAWGSVPSVGPQLQEVPGPPEAHQAQLSVSASQV